MAVHLSVLDDGDLVANIVGVCGVTKVAQVAQVTQVNVRHRRVTMYPGRIFTYA